MHIPVRMKGKQIRCGGASDYVEEGRILATEKISKDITFISVHNGHKRSRDRKLCPREVGTGYIIWPK